MIDRQALERVAATHARSMTSEPVTLEVHLQNAEVYCIASIAELFDSYFVAVVYPAEANSEELDSRPRDAKGQPTYDRVIIPYESVAYVLLTPVEGEGPWRIGF